MPDDSKQAVAAAMWAKQEGVRIATVLSDSTSYSDGLAHAFAEAAVTQAISIAGILALSEASAGVVAAQLAKERSDAVFFAPSNVGSAARLAHALGGARPGLAVYLTDVALSNQLIEQVGLDLPSWHFVFNGDPDAADRQPAFVEAFRARYGVGPSQYALNAWVLATETLRAVSATGSIDRAKVASWVLGAGDGTCSECAQVSATGDPVRWRVTGYELKAGRFHVAWQGGTAP
jgi:ABC-type branched-subunit amino acid transport system substrate-binding protein